MAYRLKPPRIGGAAYLRDYVQEIGFARACKVIDVHPNTMRRWLREATPVPQAALQALYWLTGDGFQDAFAESHWAHQENCFKVRTLEARLAELTFTAPTMAPANDPAFEGLHLVPSSDAKKPALGGL